jgi:hypothetical protein
VRIEIPEKNDGTVDFEFQFMRGQAIGSEVVKIV